MSNFEMDSRLKRDGILLGHLLISDLLLMKNAHFSWFVLVPHVNEIELYLLSNEEQQKLLHEINDVSRFIQKKFSAEKINVASLGNVVSQMHVHIVGRHASDICWPNVVWGETQFKAYKENEILDIKAALTVDLPQYFSN